MEAAWAAGTANWGTAFRHRLVAWGLLVAMAGKGWLLRRPTTSEPCSLAEGHGESSNSIRARRRALRERRRSRVKDGEHSASRRKKDGEKA